MTAKETGPLAPIVFDTLALAMVPVTLQGAKYVLCEPSAFVGCSYRDAIMERTKVDDTGKVTGHNNISDLELMLVSACLFHDTQTKADAPPIPGERVTQETIQQWPDRVTSVLYDRIKSIGKLHENTTDPTLANSQTDTTVG